MIRASNTCFGENGNADDDKILDYIFDIEGKTADELIEEYLDKEFYCHDTMLRDAIESFKKKDKIVKLNRHIPDKVQNKINELVERENK